MLNGNNGNKTRIDLDSLSHPYKGHTDYNWLKLEEEVESIFYLKTLIGSVHISLLGP